jgi:hypothetical protein
MPAGGASRWKQLAAAGGHRQPIHLDSVLGLPGGIVGTDPFRRWGSAVRWTSVVILAPIPGANWRPFNKRDVVITDVGGTHEMFREGPFTSSDAQRRQQTVVGEISTDGLATFLRRRQIEESTIGPVTASSGQLSWMQGHSIGDALVGPPQRQSIIGIDPALWDGRAFRLAVGWQAAIRGDGRGSRATNRLQLRPVPLLRHAGQPPGPLPDWPT